MCATCILLHDTKHTVYTSYNLNRMLSGPHELHTHVFVIHITWTVNYLRVWSYMRLHHLFRHKDLFYMRVLAMLCIMTTCTSIDLPQLDQVTCTAGYLCMVAENSHPPLQWICHSGKEKMQQNWQCCCSNVKAVAAIGNSAAVM